MKIGETCRLSTSGMHFLSLMGLKRGVDYDENTKVAVISEKLPCDCYSVNGRHTDDCASHYQRVKLDNAKGTTAYLSAVEITALAESHS